MSQLVWRGALLVTGITGIILFILSVWSFRGTSCKDWSKYSTIVMLSALLVYFGGIPAGYVFPFKMIFWELSTFHAVPFVCLVLVFSIQYYNLHKHIVVRNLLIMTLLLISSVSLYSLWPSIKEGSSFLVGTHPWRDTISESFPLFSVEGYAPWNLATNLFSGIFYLVPLFLVYRIFTLSRREHKTREIVLLVWIFVFTAMAIRQQRYSHQAVIPISIIASMTLLDINNYLLDKKRVYRYTLVFTIVALFVPVIVYYKYLLLTGSNTMLRIQPSFYTALKWLREETPEPGKFNEPEKKPSYGIMNQWDHGHWITWFAQRPPVANNFGSEPGGHRQGLEQSCRFYLEKNEREAL